MNARQCLSSDSHDAAGPVMWRDCILVGLVWWSLFVIVWVAIAFWPARAAARKGHSFFLYLLFSLVFFPATLIVAYVVPDGTGMMTA